MENKIWIVMPVYNEEECLRFVVEEWLLELKKHPIDFTFLIINDGSKDKTLEIIKSLAAQESRIQILDKPNSGHGQSCLEGYRKALKEGADWIFQIDSDGQCDPQFFAKVLEKMNASKVIYGFRKTRDDGKRRYIISRFVSLFTYFATGVWVRDGNVPYRMMHKDSLKDLVNTIPKDFHLANILLSVRHQKKFGIAWVNIHFRNRMGGVASVKAYSFFKHGMTLFKQLRKAGA